MVRDLFNGKQKGKLVVDLSHFAHSNIASHQPSAYLKRYMILKKLSKGNGRVVMDRDAYDRGVFNIISGS